MNFLGQWKSGYPCVSLLFAERGDGSRKNTFRGVLKRAVGGTRTFRKYGRILKRLLQKKSEKDEENYQFQVFLANSLFRLSFFHLKHYYFWRVLSFLYKNHPEIFNG